MSIVFGFDECPAISRHEAVAVISLLAHASDAGAGLSLARKLEAAVAAEQERYEVSLDAAEKGALLAALEQICSRQTPDRVQRLVDELKAEPTA